MDSTLIGYFPKRSKRGSQGPWHGKPSKPYPFEEICNVACAADEPDDWVDLWMHNGMWVFDTERRGWAVAIDGANLKGLRDKLSAQWDGVPGSIEPLMDQYIAAHIPLPYPSENPEDSSWQWDLYAYRVFPVRFDNGMQNPFEFPPLTVQPLPDDYESLGFDAVSRQMGNVFEHSSLWCNGYWNQVAVNKYCLLDDVQEAFRLGRMFSIGEFTPEGGYVGNGEPGPYFVAEVWRKKRA
jgi:hypothetical protein